MKNSILLMLLLAPMLVHAQSSGSAGKTDAEEAREFKEYQEFKRLKKTKPAPAPVKEAGESSTPTTEQARAQKTYNLTAEEREILRRGDVSTGQYIAGGIVGTVVGLGIGNAIEGRYMDRGLIFTVGELATYALFASGVNDCTYSALSGTGCSRTVSSLATVAGVSFIALRIWEIIDVWATPPSQNSEYRRVKEMSEGRPLTFFAVPSPRSGDGLASLELGLNFRF